MKYNYFVSFNCNDEQNNFGFGNTVLTLKKKINLKNENILTEMKNYIEKNNKVSNVVILNWKKI